MATIHPSRMGLVPQDPKDLYLRRGRSPSPPRRSDRDRRERENRTRGSDGESERARGGRDERRESRRDDRGSPRRRDHRDRDRGRHRSEDREDAGKRRRASPEYGDYTRPASPPSTLRMYPSRAPGDGAYERRGYGGSEYLESRRAQREGSTLSVWPPSPKAPARVLSPERGSSRRKSKRDRSETPSDSSDSESERRRRERKERKRARRERERRERRERKERRRRSVDSEDERERRSKSKSRPRSPSPSPAPSLSQGEEWVEKPVAAAPLIVATRNSGAMPPPAIIPTHAMQMDEDEEEDSDMDMGPQPLVKAITSKKVDERTYGGSLLRGEGSAMAAFLQDDTQSRIPRRGEIGLTSDEIAQFESVGYVMSGSRHKRMNAVRMRKENQVISAEEKRGILKLQKEERERREAILREEFSELVRENLKGPDTKRTVT